MDKTYWTNGLTSFVGGKKLDAYKPQEISEIILEASLPDVFVKTSRINMSKKIIFFIDYLGGGYGFIEASIPNKLYEKSAFQFITSFQIENIINTLKQLKMVDQNILDIVEQKIALNEISLTVKNKSKIML